jgi:hypothetical protein
MISAQRHQGRERHGNQPRIHDPGSAVLRDQKVEGSIVDGLLEEGAKRLRIAKRIDPPLLLHVAGTRFVPTVSTQSISDFPPWGDKCATSSEGNALARNRGPQRLRSAD